MYDKNCRICDSAQKGCIRQYSARRRINNQKIRILFQFFDQRFHPRGTQQAGRILCTSDTRQNFQRQIPIIGKCLIQADLSFQHSYDSTSLPLGKSDTLQYRRISQISVQQHYAVFFLCECFCEIHGNGCLSLSRHRACHKQNRAVGFSKPVLCSCPDELHRFFEGIRHFGVTDRDGLFFYVASFLNFRLRQISKERCVRQLFHVLCLANCFSCSHIDENQKQCNGKSRRCSDHSGIYRILAVDRGYRYAAVVYHRQRCRTDYVLCYLRIIGYDGLKYAICRIR